MWKSVTLRLPRRRGRLKRERKLGRDEEEADDGVGEVDCLGAGEFGEEGAAAEEEAARGAAAEAEAEAGVSVGVLAVAVLFAVLLDSNSDGELLDRLPISAFGANGISRVRVSLLRIREEEGNNRFGSKGLFVVQRGGLSTTGSRGTRRRVSVDVSLARRSKGLRGNFGGRVVRQGAGG